ncbi:CAAX protease self-immunity [Paracoccus halophilus]|uniref:Abortive infection protein n=1 Tax=Paracoccus halophilus TaxID=376733 RepID=A0A099F318_9RHOB|nr:CPBP family glutamic-type intramembrane protease [Paracoccus halophilus]KGJ04567.1 abortive infection protein [Paracoccus halophilus]SFA50193.1 CAAX protease self-immunity [Paracoccus halophilus]
MAEHAHAVNRGLLWAEFSALYIGAPLGIALFMPGRLLFEALAVFSIAGLALLWRTGGFDWRGLVRGFRRVPIWQVLLFGLFVGVSGWIIIQVTRPDYIRLLTPERLRLLGLIWLLYPLLSALPQELIFRPLFFHRFGSLFPDRATAVLVNATVFSFAHLMYWSIVVAVMTFIGGWIFARAYLVRGFPTAWLLHAIAGNALFTVGMGAYFWSGAVVRPF